MNINPISATYFRGGRPGMDDMTAEQKYRTARSECEGDFCAPYQAEKSKTASVSAPRQTETPAIVAASDAAYRNARSECEGDFCAPYQGSYSAGEAESSSDEKYQLSYLA